MASVAREGAGAPLVARSRLAPPWTLIAICGRDRADLVVPCLESVRAAWPETVVRFDCDPLDRELGGLELERRFRLHWVSGHPIDPAVQGSKRVALLRADAALFACRTGFQRVLFLDSDVLVDPGAGEELERLWEMRPTPDAAVTLTRFLVYDSDVRPGPPLRGAEVRTYGMGMALAFPCSAALQRAATQPVRGAWDSAWCSSVAIGVVVTPEQSWAIHEGRGTGLSAARGLPSLDVNRPTPQLEGRWQHGRQEAQRRAKRSDP